MKEEKGENIPEAEVEVDIDNKKLNFWCLIL